jgi:hypothetical protein
MMAGDNERKVSKSSVEIARVLLFSESSQSRCRTVSKTLFIALWLGMEREGGGGGGEKYVSTNAPKCGV